MEGHSEPQMRLALLLATLFLLFPAPSHAARAKDIGSFAGLRDNQLTGAGLVVGLNRTGDSQRNEASIRTLGKRLQGLGVSLDNEDLISRNVAMVMVTATLPADSRAGTRIDVTVASTGDATSLEGGVLLITPMVAANKKTYAVAEGQLLVGGYSTSAGGDTSRKNHTTVARIAGGALVEREVPRPNYDNAAVVDFVLETPDNTTIVRLADAIDATFGGEIATAMSGATLRLAIPEGFRGNFTPFAAAVEAVQVTPDAPARVVVNERTGTVVMGADVRISQVALAHGGLTIEVRRDTSVSQPGALSTGETVVTSESRIYADEKSGKLQMVEGVNIGDLVSALNDMGVKPRDLIVILQAMHSAGALHAEIVSQ